MATLTDRHNPSMVLWPVNNNRTAWRPFGLPVVLVVPHTRSAGGLPLSDSAVSNVAIIIEGAPTEALVAGHDHIGMRYPDRELYRKTLTTQELLDRRIDIDTVSFEDSSGTTIDNDEATTGDVMVYTTASGVRDRITYLADADYYDLSDITIETEQLPSGRYNLIYSCDYYLRIVTTDTIVGTSELVCIDINHDGQATLRFGLNHPGEVIREFHNLTPQPYFTGTTKSDDSTLGFYRPFTDALQDIYDEQQLLTSVNWVNRVPYEVIPHLSQLLGWDAPYFPDSVDRLRRLIIKRTRHLQQLKGSLRAIGELMALFGFTIFFKHVWYAVDGSRYIVPDERLPPAYSNQAVTYTEKYQVEPALSDYNTSGFGNIDVHLLFRPQSRDTDDPFSAPIDSADLTIDAYLVTADSSAHTALSQQITLMDDDPDGYGQSADCSQSDDGSISVGLVDDAVTGQTVLGHSKITVRNGIGYDQLLEGDEPPLKAGGISYNATTNVLNITFAKHIEFSNTSLFVVVSYKRQEATVPVEMVDLRSNRFTIQVLSRDGRDVRPDVLNFVLGFISKVKAFHSILHSVQYKVGLHEAYLVTDLCVGGDVTQRYDTAIGRQQVPPAIIPNTPGDNCRDLTPEGLGYRKIDLDYRSKLLAAIIQEYAAWAALDGRPSTDSILLRLSAASGDATRSACVYNPLGQDRVIGSADTTKSTAAHPSPNASGDSSGGKNAGKELSPYDTAVSGVGTGVTSSDSNSGAHSSFNMEGDNGRTPWCEMDGQTDYCYKGRVADVIMYRLMPTTRETVRHNPLGPSMGSGTYWTYPAPSRRHVAGAGGVNNIRLTSTRPAVYSGGTTGPGVTTTSRVYDEAARTGDTPLRRQHNNKLGRLLRSYGVPNSNHIGSSTIHYSDRDYLLHSDRPQEQLLALQRPSLNVTIATMHFPGCRFPTMGSLSDDYSSSDWRAKPWDDQYSSDEPCCGGTPSWLNATLITDDDGNESLSFDDEPFTVTGNGLAADIPGMGDHTAATIVSNSVVHAVYSNLADGHAAIDLDDVNDNGTVGTTDTFDERLFSSAVEAATGGYVDYSDGYPSERGTFTHDGADLDRGGLYGELFEAMEIPDDPATEGVTLLFRLCSGVLNGTMGFRLDGGCTLADSPPSGSVRLGCAADRYANDDGDYDFGIDKVTISQRMRLEETIGVGPYILDGSIPTMMEIS